MSRKSKKSKRPSQQSLNRSELSVSDQQKLTTKYQNIFDKQVLSEYENDNYRECIKQCDRILQIYPSNGETLAMKGLCLHCEGNSKEEDEENGENLRQSGMQLIADGLRNNIKSSICWRVKGLAHKSDKDYESAIICYKKASRYDKQNQRIYTDLASLQIELKRFNEFAQTRNELWLLNQDKLNCVALCIALYLNREYVKCNEFINDNMMHNNNHKFKINDAVELNEIYLLQSTILLKQAKYEECLEFLNDKLCKRLIVDQGAALQIKVNVERKLNKSADAINTILRMIDANEENLAYHLQYLELKPFSMNEYAALSAKYPKCNTIKRILLENCADLDAFRVLLNEYLQHKLRKSVMSLYADVRCLYLNAAKSAILDGFIAEYRSELRVNYRFMRGETRFSASPMCLLWVNYFYCNRLLDLYAFDEALRVINDNIAIVPTCIELYVLKAKVYKYVGNPQLAFKYLNYARTLDGADRYLNTKCVRYALRALKMEESQRIVTLFLKKTEGTAALHNLQVLWYQLHRAEAHLDLKQYGPCIKQYQNVYQHFETFWKNQTDFHRYSYRKCAISSYLQLLEWEDSLRNHPFFIRAAHNAINVWFKIYELQSANNYKELEFGSVKAETETDSEKRQNQNDETGWTLIHCKYPLRKVKQWLNHLLPLIHCMEPDDVTILHIYVANIKHLMLTKQYKEMISNINIILNNHRNLMNDAYFVYNMYSIKNEIKEEIQELSQYNIQFLTSYFQENGHDFDRIYCVLKCCLQINEIKENNALCLSIKDIISQIMTIECTPMQCVQIRKELRNNDHHTLLQTFEQYVEAKYPLQLKSET